MKRIVTEDRDPPAVFVPLREHAIHAAARIHQHNHLRALPDPLHHLLRPVHTGKPENNGTDRHRCGNAERAVERVRYRILRQHGERRIRDFRLTVADERQQRD